MRLLLLAQQDGSFWLPEPAAVSASSVDTAFYFILYTALFFFALIITLMFAFIIRYRQRKPGEIAPGKVSHSTALELVWTIIPVILVLVMFWMGFQAYMEIRSIPAGAMEIQVEARKWAWEFRYTAPDGTLVTHEELHVPLDTPVRLVMRSKDVIHSLFIPAFRVKRDVVPGRKADIWFKATKPGTYPLLCAEYCGTAHSDMTTVCVVHEPGEYEKWLETANPLNALTEEQKAEYFADPEAFVEKYKDDPILSKLETPAIAGEKLVAKKGCLQCHRLDGSAGQGNAPSFLNAFDPERQFRDGSKLSDYPGLIPEAYLRESILVPSEKIVAGADNIMPKIMLTDAEIDQIIAYIKTLKPKGNE